MLHAQMLRQGPHHVLERLAHQHDLGTGLHQFPHLLNTGLFQVRLQLVLKELFAQQVEAVARYAAEYGVDYARGKFPVRGVQKRAQQRHQEDQATAPEALCERLSIPGKERHWPDNRQVKKTSLYTPIDG